jgi:hypothetical protein
MLSAFPLVAGLLAAPPAVAGPAPDAQPAPAPTRAPRSTRPRRFLVGLEGVGMQVPALRSPVVQLDPRFLGATVAMGGLGALGRARIAPPVAAELSLRSGSVRYRDEHGDTGAVVSHDLLLATAGLSLFPVRGEVAHLGVDGGIGGAFQRIRYELGPDGDASTQTFGSLLVHAGVALELSVRRVAFLVSLRAYGVVTDDGAARNRGPAFRGLPDAARRAAAPTYQTFVVGGLGVAYRF